MNLKRLCQSKGHSAPPDQSFGAAARETNLPLLSREFDRLSGGNSEIAYQSFRPALLPSNTQLLLLVIVGHTRLGGTAAAEPSSK